MSGDSDERPDGGFRSVLSWSGFDPIRKRYHVKFGLALLVMALSIGAIGVAATDTISNQTENNVEDEYRGVSESERANDLQRYAQAVRDILDRFETEAEHEFVFSVGPTGGATAESESPD